MVLDLTAQFFERYGRLSCQRNPPSTVMDAILYLQHECMSVFLIAPPSRYWDCTLICACLPLIKFIDSFANAEIFFCN